MTDPQTPKANHPPDKPDQVAAPQAMSGLGITSMVLGIVSFTGPGLVLGVPAIIMAAIELKRHTPNREFAITGLVTGIISTVFSLLVIAIVVIFSIWSYNNPEGFQNFYNDTPPQTQQFESSHL
jgi:uncharacterized membrane protein